MRRLIVQWFGVVVICCVGFTSSAQEDTASFDSDKLYAVGRELAFADKTEQGRKWLKLALEKSPGYLEIKVFLARTYAWDKQRSTALTLLDEVLAVEPKNKDATYAKLDVLYWDENYVGTVAFADKQLKYYATDIQILLKKAKALIALDFLTEAASLLEQVLKIDPNNEEAKELLESLKAAQLKNAVAVNYQIDHFGKIFGNAHYEFIQYSRRTKYGSVIGRINTSQRFDTSGIQPEIDFYPTFGKGFYGYLNYGISGTALYPKHRVGVELYKNLPFRLEASLGARYLYFNRSSNVRIYTATLGWYVGNWWLNLRGYLTPDDISKTISRSLTFLGRRYFSNAQTYVGVIANIGFTPGGLLQAGLDSNGDSGSNVYFLKSHRFGFDAQKTVGKRFIVGGQATWADLELVFDKGNFVNIWTGQITVSYLF